jgi:predicted HTH domain antitoxin
VVISLGESSPNIKLVAVKGCEKMSVINLSFPVEREVLFALRQDEELFLNDIRKILALRYFQSQQLSLGLAARLADMDKDDFIQYLGVNQIDIYQYTEREFDDEMKFLSGLGKKL